jgi:hypothetical protein
MLIGENVCRAAAPTRLALLGHEMLLACRRWAALTAGLQARMAEQTERIVAQLMICQLPRVEDRVESMLWLLAETWGQVGAQGTLLPVALTHETLGGLIGAQRSTVTLALGELADRGTVLKLDRGWLLPGQPPTPGHAARLEMPELETAHPSAWHTPPPNGEHEHAHAHAVSVDLLTTRAIIEQLHAQQAESARTNEHRRGQLRTTLERSRVIRAEARATISSRSAPSSVSRQRPDRPQSSPAATAGPGTKTPSRAGLSPPV